MSTPDTFTAFLDDRRLAAGPLATVAERIRSLLETQPDALPAIYDDATGRVVDLDFRGSAADVAARLPAAEAPAARRGPGRPRLGVVAREVTLMPRHWDWLAAQPGGASVALRKLVEAASREGAPADRVRKAMEATDRVMLALAGNLPGYEEASRAFHRHDAERLAAITQAWPADVRDYVNQLASRATSAA